MTQAAVVYAVAWAAAYHECRNSQGGMAVPDAVEFCGRIAFEALLDWKNAEAAIAQTYDDGLDFISK